MNILKYRPINLNAKSYFAQNMEASRIILQVVTSICSLGIMSKRYLRSPNLCLRNHILISKTNCVHPTIKQIMVTEFVSDDLNTPFNPSFSLKGKNNFF